MSDSSGKSVAIIGVIIGIISMVFPLFSGQDVIKTESGYMWSGAEKITYFSFAYFFQLLQTITFDIKLDLYSAFVLLPYILIPISIIIVFAGFFDWGSWKKRLWIPGLMMLLSFALVYGFIIFFRTVMNSMPVGSSILILKEGIGLYLTLLTGVVWIIPSLIDVLKTIRVKVNNVIGKKA